jgi:hypothetical protein
MNQLPGTLEVYPDLYRDIFNLQISKKKKRRKTSWVGHILCRNFILKHVIGTKIGGRSDGKTMKKK